MSLEAIKSIRYLEHSEILQNLEGVEYIVFVEPSPSEFIDTPLHFTLFLNTSQELPSHIVKLVVDKFIKQHSIFNPQKMLASLMSVGFSVGTQQKHMPLLITKPEELSQIPHISLFVIDFVANSQMFDDVKSKGISGWSYVLNS